jgi:hypothetical protein
MIKPAPRDLSQDALFALFHMLLQLLEEKKVLTNGEFAAHVALQSNRAKIEHPTMYALSTLSEVDRVMTWLRDHPKP